MSNNYETIPEAEEIEGVKWVLFGSAVVFGIGFGSIVGLIINSPLGCLAGLLFSILHPIVGAHVVPLCEKLRVVAFPHSPALGKSAKVLVGAFWPFTLSFWIIMALYFGIINHYYRS